MQAQSAASQLNQQASMYAQQAAAGLNTREGEYYPLEISFDMFSFLGGRKGNSSNDNQENVEGGDDND